MKDISECYRLYSVMFLWFENYCLMPSVYRGSN